MEAIIILLIFSFAANAVFVFLIIDMRNKVAEHSAKPVRKEGKVLLCGRCGARVGHIDSFCSICGTRIDKTKSK